MSWQTAVERTVTGLGYDLVDVERGVRGLLQVFIDRLPGQVYPTGEGESVTVDDCELVTRQLQYVLEVENAPYERLEVSSPGLDRPLKKAADYERFTGAEIDLTLKVPFQGRKKYRGVLEAREEGGWRLVFNDGKVDQALDFNLDEVRESKLVPVISFKKAGRSGKAAEPARPGGTAVEQVDGGQKQ
jgi:ribosome maturation factor RimP